MNFADQHRIHIADQTLSVVDVFLDRLSNMADRVGRLGFEVLDAGEGGDM